MHFRSDSGHLAGVLTQSMSREIFDTSYVTQRQLNNGDKKMILYYTFLNVILVAHALSFVTGGVK